MTQKLNVIIGSTRPGRKGPAVARWFAEFARGKQDFEVELVDLAEFGLPLLDEAAHPSLQKYEHEHTRRWSRSVASADAFVFVTPEYDFFPPAALVNAVQTVLKEWARKPAGIVCYGGVSGGLRSAQQLRLLLSSVNVHAVSQMVPLPFFAKLLDDDERFQPTAQIEEGATAMLAELAAWSKALKTIRAA
ncbi:MAG: NADPH-dependent FMN reductase [Cereibacter sphaeroides]|uniref:NADPH-dependent FMN reductase n=1 Tax=Cereibacter sphaeroides TaxID=1063 RepID=A0A2W5USA7_CERSP|nr:MAG: NADPH-dependent FMN reductase [Cereibacter sphaeroides]